MLLAALLDRLPDLRPEVRHVSHRHVHRDEGEDGLTEGEWATQEVEVRHAEVEGRRYRSGEQAGARSSMLCSGESEP